jgi:hypothetical protein
MVQEKTKKTFLVVFLVGCSARKHLAFLALTLPGFFTFPGGGPDPPPFFFRAIFSFGSSIGLSIARPSFWPISPEYSSPFEKVDVTKSE